MCAICGIFNFDGLPIHRSLLERMKDSLRHRGPDEQGVLVDREVGLGHCRLSIIDVERGTQPVGNEDGTVQVVFNGEIYNFVELRVELESAGHRFKTRSDTEVIVHAYEQWGRECVKRFNGMFSFALWDMNRHELLLARDHLGIKPLYYVTVGRTFLFASEIKALLQHPACPREVDLEALAELFTFRYVPSPKTLFKHIFKLPPAHLMKVTQTELRQERFWNWVPNSRVVRSEAEIVEEYRHLLESAVRWQLRSDVPLGLFLSSGIDSGVLLAIMSQYCNGPVQTFTIGFEGGEKTNEVLDAQALARQFGAQHHFQIIGPDDYINYYERYMWDLEEPVGNETAAAFYFVSRITANKVKVALTGQGADELWAGYDRYKGIKLSQIYSMLPDLLTRSLDLLVRHLPGRLERLQRGTASLSEPDLLMRFTKVYSFFNADLKARLYSGSLKKLFDADPYGPRHALARLQADVARHDPLTQILYIDTRASLPDDLLMVADKTSMACSLEVRVPFLDVRLVEFVESLPPQLKLKGLMGKYLHKRACEKWLPRKLIFRRKKGFANSIEDWFRVRLAPFVDECLLSKDSFIRQYFNQASVKRMLELDRSGRVQYRRHIYLLVSLELWHRAFLRH